MATPPPADSPAPDIAKPSKRPTREIDVTELSADFKKRKRQRPVRYAAAIAAVVSALGGGGYSIASGADAKERVDTVQARFDERLKAAQKEADEKKRADDELHAKQAEDMSKLREDTAVTKAGVKLLLKALKVKGE